MPLLHLLFWPEMRLHNDFHFGTVMDHFDSGIVFITGGTSGLGLASAVALAKRGANLALFSSGATQPEAALETVRQARKREGQHVTWFCANVADRDQVLTAFAAARQQIGEPDIVIHMAGIGGLAPMADMPLTDFDRIMQVNVYGTRHVAEAALLSMRPRRCGKIVLAGSLGGWVPVYGYTAYGTSKFAVVGFAQCLRYELKPLGVNVACFCPGEVETPGLFAEREHTHPAAVVLKQIVGTLPLDKAVKSLLRGIEADRFLIVPGLRAKLIYLALRLTPLPIWLAVTDTLVGYALRKSQSLNDRSS